MTLQELLKQSQSQPKSTSPNQLAEQKAKTSALLSANKAAASRILLGALAQLESNSSTSSVKEKKIWI